MSIRQDLIAKALGERLDELRNERIRRLATETFDESAPFVSQLREALVNALLDQPANQPFSVGTPGVWMNSETDCLASLRALSLGQQLSLSEAAPPPIDHFLRSLDEHRRDPDRCFELLLERYSCPLNFALRDEDQIREHVLTRLMVQDRARIEQNSVANIAADDLLLKLNLVATHAQVTSDLRFLDALNYYYELLPADWVPRARHKWLLASYLGLYARALATGILRKQTVAHSDTL